MGNLRFRPMSVSEWLDGYGKAKHDARFVEHFDSLADLRAAAADVDVGVAGVLRECDVTTLGDKSVLKRALEELLALDEEGLPEVEEEVEGEAPRKWYDPLNIL